MAIKAILAGAVLGLGSGASLAQAPSSAIDWLSDSVASETQSSAESTTGEAAVTGSAGVENITVTALEDVSTDAVGLLPASVTGLPGNLWGSTPSAELAGLFGTLETGLLPAMQDLLITLLLAELDPPADSDPSGQLFLARIDALLALGAVDQAQALLDRAGPDDVERFRRWFDASLLTGTENDACEKLRNSPGLSPTMPARIFCLARSGDWNAAALTLETGRALDELTSAEDALLTRFLDVETTENAQPLRAPQRPSPLIFRLYESIGESLTTTTLPVAFAQADLRSNTGWKPQIEAAERLARTGALAANKLLGLYTERLPAASGGVWDRVAVIQRFDAAISDGSPDLVAAVLPDAWEAMKTVRLETVFSSVYGARIADLQLADDAGSLGFRIALLTQGYETIAKQYQPATPTDRFLQALAQGELAGIQAPDAVARAVADGFLAATVPPALAQQVSQGNLGAAILQSIALMSEGAGGDLNKLTNAIALFRAIGLEDVARRAALQVLILDRRE